MKDRLDKAIEYAENKLMNCDKTCGCGCSVDLGCIGKPKKELKVLKFYNNLFTNRIGIQLKNIDLTGYKFDKQFSKLVEEHDEFYKVFMFKDEDNSFEHVSEEFFDVIQAMLGIIQMRFNKTADEVMAEYPKHLEKMESRGNKPREKVEK